MSIHRFSRFFAVNVREGGLGVLPYMSSLDGLLMGYIGMYRFQGHDFQAVSSGIGYINQRVWVLGRVSFSRKLINWLKVLV